MSITRTTETDDSGAGTDGTIHNNAWLQAIYDALDARWSRTTITSTGTQNNLSYSEADFVLLNNASDLTITGLAAPSSPAKPGKILVFKSLGAGNVYFKHNNASSSAANRLTHFATSGDTPLAAGVGVALYQYDDANSLWRLIHHEQGAFITPTYAGGNFTGSGSMTWTVDSGDVTTCCYYLRGRTLTILLELVNTSTAGTASTNLNVSNAAYGGFTQAKNLTMPCIINDNSTGFAAGHAVFGPAIGGSATSISFFKLPTANWALSTNLTTVNGSFVVEVT